MVNLTWGIFFTLVFLLAKLIIDTNKRFDNKPINHKKEWLILAGVSSIPVLFFVASSGLKWYFSAPLSSTMIAFFYWMFFDGFFNLWRGFNWWFTGTDDPDDAKTDNFLQNLTLNQHITVKAVPLLLLIIFYIITLK